MAVDGKCGVGRAAGVLGVYEEMGCGIVGLQETYYYSRRSGHSAFLQACYVVFYSGESGGDERKGTRVKVEFDWLFARVSIVP